ncbi:DNA-directed RNA polymerase I [Filobasidium floriforme]|uniref:DNA-directed RNA polymerase I n=1 Tax=Filobasidium floriforme TaxID=5210 RepID=UPI001E8DE017|nr:DNA-directed RNA polymerase I [Filobasidium floriforme]KAH8090947.1 DNA-directed RNA polymerase I [Filobasidium floriforme]
MDASESREVVTAWKVFRTVHEMLEDRGYNVGEESKTISYPDFRETYAASGMPDRNAMSNWYTTKLTPTQTIYVNFTDVENVAKKDIRSFVNVMEEKQCERGIMLYRKKLTPSAKKTIQELQGDYKIEEYAEADLVVNITKHFLVPKHTIMSDKDKKDLLNRYRLKDTQLPRIQLSDPVARYYGLLRGQVMKIDRESETAGRYITYRVGF